MHSVVYQNSPFCIYYIKSPIWYTEKRVKSMFPVSPMSRLGVTSRAGPGESTVSSAGSTAKDQSTGSLRITTFVSFSVGMGGS